MSTTPTTPATTATIPTHHTSAAPLTGAPACPTCGGRMWDNRATKRNPKAPDFKCRNRSCDGVLWPGQHTAAVPIIATRATRPSLAVPAPAREPAPALVAASQPATHDAAGQGSASPTPRADTSRATSGATAPQGSPRTALEACYLDVTDFVLADVCPRYAAANVPCTDATVAAIAATLFIATCRTPRHTEGT